MQVPDGFRSDVGLAKELGYRSTKTLRNLLERLLKKGTLEASDVFTESRYSPQAGKNYNVYYVNSRGEYMLAMQGNAPRKMEWVRKWAENLPKGALASFFESAVKS